MSFRPFSLGDILLLQRLRKYSTRLQIERTLLEPTSPMRSALSSCLPWYAHNSYSYVLRQDEHGLAREGLIQLHLRPHSHDADVTLLAPALDAPQGHPAIWQKLLNQSAHHLARQRVDRLYADLPDQPLLVNTLKQVGFSLFTRVTIWRLVTAPLAWSDSPSGLIRAQQESDAWDLSKLYARATPKLVQQLESGPTAHQTENGNRKPVILANPHHLPMSGYVLTGAKEGDLTGCVQIIWGSRAAWIRLWIDTNDPDSESVHHLLRFALQRIIEAPHTLRTYISVREYQTGLNALLADYGFAPFTDRALMVRTMMQWVRQPVGKRMPALESVREAVSGSVIRTNRSLSIPSGVDSGMNGTEHDPLTYF